MKWILKFAALVAKILPTQMKAWLYRSPKLATKIRSTLNSASPVGLTEMQIAGGLLQGFQIQLDMQTEKDYWLGTYEIDLQAAFRKFCKPGMTVYDIGANIGYISLMAAKQAGETGHVIAFEPLPANCERLRKNIALNNLQTRITLQQSAVVDNPGRITFMVHRSGAMGKAQGSLGRDEQYIDRVEVDAIGLDDFIFLKQNLRPDLIKMDIEGGEALAVAGMQRTLSEIRPVILIEIHSHQALERVWQALHNANYQVFRMEKGFPHIQDIAELGEKTYAIATPVK
ncbi:MAG TPA: hypothetical protein DCK95_09000 [Anaerolineaceae bacterium]|nr:hypothetical protein [Anaerolineaceae bacterium]